MFLRTRALEEVGLFDERFFMYLEDVDLCRRIRRGWDTVLYPHVQVFHEYARGSYTDPVLRRHHIVSAIRYFNKWGWLFDEERNAFNAACDVPERIVRFDRLEWKAAGSRSKCSSQT